MLFSFVFFVRENCNFGIPDMFSGGPIQGLCSICFFLRFFSIWAYFGFVFLICFLAFNCFLDFGFLGGVSTVKFNHPFKGLRFRFTGRLHCILWCIGVSMFLFNMRVFNGLGCSWEKVPNFTSCPQNAEQRHGKFNGHKKCAYMVKLEDMMWVLSPNPSMQVTLQ